VNVGIRTRLGLWYGAVLAVTVAALGILVWARFGAVLRESVNDALVVQVDDVRAGLAGDSSNVIRLDPARPGVFTVVLDRTGRIERESRDLPAGFTVPPVGASTMTFGTGPERYAVYAENGPDGRKIVAGQSLTDIDLSLASLARLLAVVGVGGGILSIAGGWWLAGRALGPVAALTREAQAIGIAGLDRRLPVRGGGDELGRLAQTMNGMLDRVAAAVRRERAFVVAASHDLRTPITALRTELELAARGHGTRAQLMSAVRESHADAVRLSELTADLLRLAEAEPTGRELLRQPVGIDELVEGSLRRVIPTANERGVRVVPRVPSSVVRVDRIRLEQAIVNLVANAIRDAPIGSEVEVEAELTDPPDIDGRRMTVQVLDRGPGVPDDLREMLFVPFAAKSRGHMRGHGLGLAVAAAAVRAHDGAIGYRDRAGGGAEFWLTVPV